MSAYIWLMPLAMPTRTTHTRHRMRSKRLKESSMSIHTQKALEALRTAHTGSSKYLAHIAGRIRDYS